MPTRIEVKKVNCHYRVKCGRNFLHGKHDSWLSAAQRALRHFQIGHINDGDTVIDLNEDENDGV